MLPQNYFSFRFLKHEEKICCLPFKTSFYVLLYGMVIQNVTKLQIKNTAPFALLKPLYLFCGVIKTLTEPPRVKAVFYHILFVVVYIIMCKMKVNQKIFL